MMELLLILPQCKAVFGFSQPRLMDMIKEIGFVASVVT
jgi:hypothetical protein